ncbi:MAG: hypothetical protein QGH93_12435 [Gammaproteobacteria bacterium]|jgi:hypothetical protein|nr:hypothetical protein [Chromatiales bacterium]MDP6675640.1 hypothetical protein [Gammaproteobacteria bacterium]
MEAPPAQSRRWVLTSVNETLDATVDLVGITDRRISIFTADLEPDIYNNERFLEAVKHLTLGKPFVRIRVLIANPGRVVRSGNPFVQLARRLSACIEFSNVAEEFRDHREAFLIVDETALIYRVDSSKWEGIADTHEPAVARRYLGLFDEVWNSSSVQTERRELRV